VKTVAALYVATNGCYYGLPDVDPWDKARDARLYEGPHPVVAHPPCGPWGRYAKIHGTLGQDDGCFAAAFRAVNDFGGVIEHPEGSHAWRAFRIPDPPRGGGWILAASSPGVWTCCVAQGNYGHRARKLTWLLFVGTNPPPSLDWSKCIRRVPGADQATGMERRRLIRTGVCQRLSHRQRAATPLPFRDLLLSLARMAGR
jgi:hypothetical protein